MEGFVLVDKPIGPTSFAMVARVKRLTGQKRVGHAGTLDPFASGLLILALGRTFTRQIDRFQAMEKGYDVTLDLGYETDTEDLTGTTVATMTPTQDWTDVVFCQDMSEKVRAIVPEFVGEIEQVPPMFSAKSVDGTRLYQLARQGVTVERKPSRIWIRSIEIVDIQTTKGIQVSLRVRSSKGTYVRSLVRDIGRRLGTFATATALRRMSIGAFHVDDAVAGEFDLDAIQKTIRQEMVAIV